jgi:hypothetical protein
MKTFLLAALLVASPAALASPAPKEVAVKNTSSGTGPPSTHTSRSVTVLSDGSVAVHENNKGKQHDSKKTLAKDKLAKLVACESEVKKAKKLPNNSCAGGSFMSYTLGEVVISRHACGQTPKVASPCVGGALAILDSL